MGLSPQVFGDEQGYVQSDMQFALEVVDDLRQYLKPSDTKIPRRYYMDIYSRFFTSESTEGARDENYMVASELHITEGEHLKMLNYKKLLKVQEVVMGEEELELDAMAVHHGHDFDNMAVTDEYVKLENKVIDGFLFDTGNHFAGFRTWNPQHDTENVHKAVDASKLRFSEVDKQIVDSIDHTRLIGFRTTKKCDEGKVISSVQPIYFSIDKTMCKDYLKPVSAGLMEEISGFGPTCDGGYVENVGVMHRTTVVEGQSDFTAQMVVATFVLMVVILVILLCIGACKCKTMIAQRRERKRNKEE